MPKDTSEKVPQRGKIDSNLGIKPFNWTPKQQEIIDCILNKDSRVIFIDGVAGTGKTALTTYCGLKLIEEKRLSHIVFVRTVVESASKGMGFLPGELWQKIQPFLMPLDDKLQELLPKYSIDKLYKEKRIQPIPVNFLRGASFNATFVFLEESQNFSYQELVTSLTRSNVV